MQYVRGYGTLIVIAIVSVSFLFLTSNNIKPEPETELVDVIQETTVTVEDTSSIEKEAPSPATWQGPVESSVFGGRLDEQPIAYPYEGMRHTSELNAAGVHYFASRNVGWRGKWIEFEYKGNIVAGVMVDFGPAEWTGRYFDFGPSLATALRYETDGLVMWRFYDE